MIQDVVEQEIDKIKSLKEALTHIARLNAFALNNFLAYKKLYNLETLFEEMHTKWKQANFKQAIIRQFFPITT